MPPVEDVKEVMEEVSVQVLIGDEDSEVKVANEGGEDVTGDEDDEDEEDVDEDEDDDDEDDDDDEEEEDLGTEYLVKPVGEGCEDDDEDSSDFNPEENDVDDDIDDDDDDEEDEIEDDISKLSAGKSEPRTKRKRVAKEDNSEQEASVTGEEGDVRPSKR